MIALVVYNVYLVVYNVCHNVCHGMKAVYIVMFILEKRWLCCQCVSVANWFVQLCR